MYEEYLKKMEIRLKELDAEVARLKAKAEASRVELKGKYLEQIGRLREARERAGADLVKLREAGSDRYEQVRKDAERAFGDLKKGIDEILERIRKAA